MSDTVTFISIHTPFDPTKHDRIEKEWCAVRSVDSYLSEIVDYPGDLVVSVDGKVFERHQLTTIYLSPESNVVVCPVPHGGGDSKSILRIVALVALAVFAPTIAGAIGSSMGVAAGTVGASMIKAGVMIAGSMLINAMLPMEPPKRKNGEEDGGSSYGIDGAKNVAQEGVAVPVCYGTFRMGGNIIGTYVENYGKTQYLNMLLNAGEGPISDISDILINDQPLENYSEVQIEKRMGTSDQGVIPWFDDIVTPVSKGVKLTQEWKQHNTVTTIDKFRVDVVFPQGLVNGDNKKGYKNAQTVSIDVRYRKVGDSEWSYIWADGSHALTVTAKALYAYRASVMSPLLSEGQYEIQYRRANPQVSDSNDKVSDEVHVSDVNEIVVDDVAYIHTALLGVRIKLSDQLSGLPKITYLNHGRVLRVWDGATWSDQASTNPAWIAYDILTHKRYGAGFKEDRVDLSRWLDWAEYCDRENLTFNGVVDSTMNMWDALQAVMRAGHAQIINVGTRFSVAIERADTPVMMFSVANIVEGTFQETWLPLSDRANEIEVNYYDKANDYKRTQIKLYDAERLSAGEPQRPSEVTLSGVVDHERAYREARLHLNLNRLITQTVKFDAPIDAIACTIGDLIYVQHDMPQWGFGGRVEKNCTAQVIELDRDVTMKSGVQYKLLLNHDAVKTNEGTITSIVGNGVYLSTFDGASIPDRLVSGTTDVQVQNVFDAGNGTWGVVVDDVSSLSIGSNYALWKTDVVEERDVVNTGDTVASVTVTQPFSQAPTAYTQFMFGETGKVKKPFRVKSISGTHEYNRTIEAIEYNEDVYDLSGIAMTPPNYSSLATTVPHVTIDKVTEELILTAGGPEVDVTVHYRNGNELYRGSVVYLSSNFGEYVEIGRGANNVTVRAKDRDFLTFKVVAYDTLGKSAPYDTAPSLNHEVVGKLAAPADVTGLKARQVSGGFELTWGESLDVDVSGYEVREGVSWDLGVVLAEKHGSTTFFAPVDEAREYKFFVKAVDTSARKSDGTAVVTVKATEPAPVVYFDCIQSADVITFQWDAVAGGNITYEIREGASWQEAMVVGSISGTRFAISADTAGTRKFWIKARNHLGLYSPQAVFSTTSVATLPNRNVVATYDEIASGLLGVKHNVSRETGGELRLNHGEASGEYVFPVDLGGVVRARNVLSATLRAVLESANDWVGATYAWDSSSAASTWTPLGNGSAVSMSPFISRHVGLSANYIDEIGLHAAVTSEGGVTPTEQTNVTYDDGRFAGGAVIGDFTKLSWPLNLPAEFRTTFWVHLTQQDDAVYWEASGLSGSLRVVYDGSSNGFFLEDDTGSKVPSSSKVKAGDRAMIVINQTAANRQLGVSVLGGGRDLAEAALPPVGALDTVRLYGVA